MGVGGSGYWMLGSEKNNYDNLVSSHCRCLDFSLFQLEFVFLYPVQKEGC